MADVERLLISWGKTTLGGRFGTDTPANLADVLPFRQITRIGGPSHIDNPRFDMPTVTTDCYGQDRASAIALAEELDDALRLLLPGQTVDNATVTRVETISGPSFRPWDDTSLRRIGATYRLHIKSRI